MTGAPFTEVRTVKALWAVFGKAEGSSSGYTVLRASHGQLAFYENQIRRHLPGTPPTPCYTFVPGPAAKNRQAALASCSKLMPTDIRDAAGRPSIRLHHFAVEFSDIVGPSGAAGPALACYADLAAAMDAAIMPESEQDFAMLPVRPSGRQAIGEAVSRRSFDWLATGAAALLAGRVVITRAGDVPVAERLACLDSIAGLLPFGARSSLAVSTWADRGTVHELRLFFADTAGQDAFELPWRTPPGELRDQHARDYRDLLERCRRELEYAGEDLTLGLVEPLARQIGPLDLNRPDEIIRVLRTCVATVPEAAIRRLIAAEASREEVRRFLSTGRGNVAGVPVSDRVACLTELLRNATVPVTPEQLRRLDVPCTRSHLDVLAQGLRRVLGEPDVRRADAVKVAAEYCAKARESGLLGELLTGIFSKVNANDDLRIAALADLAEQTHYPPELCELLHRPSTLSVTLLLRLLQTDPERAATHLNRLCAHPDRQLWLIPLHDLVNGRPDIRVGSPDKDWLVDEIPDYIYLVLAAASSARRMEVAAGWMFPQLVTIAMTGDVPRLGQYLDDDDPGERVAVLRALIWPERASAIDVPGVVRRLLRDLIPFVTALPARIIQLLDGPATAIDLLGTDPALDRELTLWLLDQENQLMAQWRERPPDDLVRDRLRSVRALTHLARQAELATVSALARTEADRDVADAIRHAIGQDVPPDLIIEQLNPLDVDRLHQILRAVAGDDEDLFHRLADPVLDALDSERADALLSRLQEQLRREVRAENEMSRRLRRRRGHLEGLGAR